MKKQPVPIGVLTLRNGITATLTPGKGWESADARLTELLNGRFSLEHASPADGAFGWRQLEEAGRILGAKVNKVPQEPSEPGVIY